MNSTNNQTYLVTCYVLDDKAQGVIHFPTRESILIFIFALLVVILLTFTTVFLNSITVITIWRSRVLKEKTSNFTILLQSTVDLLNGAIIMPIIACRLATEIAGHPSCALMYFAKKSAMLMFFYSLTTLSAMNFDRYMGVVHPFTHRSEVTNDRLLKYVVGVCVIQTVIYGFTLTHNKIIRPLSALICVAFTLTTAFAYFRIFMVIRKNAVGVTLVESSGKNNENECQNVTTKRSYRARFLKEVKAAKSSLLVVICCLVCYNPAILSFGLLPLTDSFKGIATKVWVAILALLNSTLNSVIHFWMNAILRKHSKDLIKSILNSYR